MIIDGRKFMYNYIQASELFNKKHYKYKIDLFLDFYFLNIFIRNINESKSYKFQIMIDKMNFLSIDEIYNLYNNLVKKCYKR